MSLIDVPMSPDNDVPMSPVDDADLENVVVGSVRKLEEVVADTGTGRSIRKCTSIQKAISPHDVNVMVVLDYGYGGAGAGDKLTTIQETELENTISNDDKLTTIQKTEFDNIISNDGLKLPIYHILLWDSLRAMADTFSSKDFSLLLKYVFQTDPSSIRNLSFEDALKHELVATCVWFLLTEECPRIIKEGLASALQLILFIAPKATYMLEDDQGESVVRARRMSVDQKAYIDTLVVVALCVDDLEIIRQVCEAIYQVVGLRTTNTVSTGIQSELVKLARRFPNDRDTCGHAALALLNCINRINSKSDNGFMREELFQAVRSDSEWLLNIMDGADEDLLTEAYDILEGISSGKYDEDLWEALLYQFVPAILNRVDGVEPRMDLYDIDVVRKAATIISNTINKASSRDAIRSLVVDMDCLRFLVGFLGLPAGEDFITCACMEAVEKILEMDDDDSEFAMMIGENGYLLLGKTTVMRVKAGWHLLHNNAPNSERVISKYAPAEWQPDKFAEIHLRLGEGDDDIVGSFGYL